MVVFSDEVIDINTILTNVTKKEMLHLNHAKKLQGWSTFDAQQIYLNEGALLKVILNTC